ncbi:MAG: acetolactate decarboxylase [Ginsengibacter sp.]
MISRKILYTLMSCICWISMSVQGQANSQIGKDGILFQYGLLNGFMGGLYDGVLSIDQLKKHGNFGLGAPDRLDGELVMEKGRIYQTQFTGKTFVPQNSTKSCLAMLCFFNADTAVRSHRSHDVKEAYMFIDSFLKNKNGMYAVRIKGQFEYVKTRAFPPVTSQPYPDITSLMDLQRFFELYKVKGVFVGFKLPSFLDEVSIPGYHFHFLSEDKINGGHVTDFTWKDVEIEIQELHQLQLLLPQTYDFRNFNFQKNRSADLKKLERGGEK